jgi:hypothetical protein
MALVATAMTVTQLPEIINPLAFSTLGKPFKYVQLFIDVSKLCEFKRQKNDALHKVYILTC